MMKKLALNQTTYNRLDNYDEETFYFIDNALKDGEIKNASNYLLSEEVDKLMKEKAIESREE